MAKREKTVGEILNKLDLSQKEITEKLRSLVRDVVPDAIEIVRRGKIAYVVNGKDFAWIFHSKGHVDLDFVCGTRIGSKLLKGRGKGKDLRHIEIKTRKDLDEIELERLLKNASEIAC